MTKKKLNFEKGETVVFQIKNLKKVTSKRNSWKHQMYELEIAIAKESSNKKRDELIKLHNGYMSEYDSLKKQIIWLAVLGNMFPSGLGDFGAILFGIAITVRTCPIRLLGFKNEFKI